MLSPAPFNAHNSPFNAEIRLFDAKSFTSPYIPRYHSPCPAESNPKRPTGERVRTALGLSALPTIQCPSSLSSLPSMASLCFHILTNCLPRKSSILIAIRIARGYTLSASSGSFPCYPAFSLKCLVFKSLPPLCPLLRALTLCFQRLAASFRKIPGVGVCP